MGLQQAVEVAPHRPVEQPGAGDLVERQAQQLPLGGQQHQLVAGCLGAVVQPLPGLGAHDVALQQPAGMLHLQARALETVEEGGEGPALGNVDVEFLQALFTGLLGVVAQRPEGAPGQVQGDQALEHVVHLPGLEAQLDLLVSPHPAAPLEVTHPVLEQYHPGDLRHGVLLGPRSAPVVAGIPGGRL